MNTERTEKFVNAIACDLEEGGFRQVSGTTLRRTLATAVSAALPLLAEQQGEDAVGDQLLDEMRDVEDYFNDVEPNPIHLATVQAAISALAATGKQQVGEVQGDALAMIGSNLRSILDLASKMGGGSYQITVANIQHETNHALQLLEAALAARQPGVPNGKLVGWWNGITPGYDGQGDWSIRWGADAENSRHDIPLYDGFNPIHYQQPAQGIDLEQKKREAEIECLDGFLRMTFEPVGQQCCGRAGQECCGDAIPVYATPNEVFEAMQNRMRDLLDQRDAAPGVGNG